MAGQISIRIPATILGRMILQRVTFWAVMTERSSTTLILIKSRPVMEPVKEIMLENWQNSGKHFPLKTSWTGPLYSYTVVSTEETSWSKMVTFRESWIGNLPAPIH